MEVRLYEKAMKLAMLRDISINPYEPVITVGAVNWGAALATFVTKKMLFEAQFNLAEGKERPAQETSSVNNDEESR